MNVGMLTTSFPRYRGDYFGIFVYGLARALVESGVAVHVVAPHAPGAKRRERLDGIDVHRFQYALPVSYQRVAYDGSGPSSGGGGVLPNLRRSTLAKLQLTPFVLGLWLKSMAVCKDCDIVHAHWTPSGMIALCVSRLWRKPTVLTVHGSDINVARGKLARRFSTLVLNGVDRLIPVSRDLAEKVRTLGVAAEKITVIPNGVDTEQFAPKAERGRGCNVLWVGRMIPEKGVEYLLRAMPLVLARFPQAHLTLVGDGPLRKQQETLARDLSVESRVVFEGGRPHTEIAGYMRDADVVAFPSLAEGFGLVLLEAMATGKPIVASRVGGIPDLVVDDGEEGSTGILVPPCNTAALAEALVALLEDSERRETMGRNARRLVEQGFSWKEIARRTTAVYQQALSGRV